MKKLEPRVKLTKTELLMVVNHRPHKRELLLPMIEDIDSRVSEEDQLWMVETIIEVLGMPAPVTSTAEQDPDAMATEE